MSVNFTAFGALSKEGATWAHNRPIIHVIH